MLDKSPNASIVLQLMDQGLSYSDALDEVVNDYKKRLEEELNIYI